MKKIPTLFVRDPENRARVLDQVTPGCEWVAAGEGVATVKWDGTCVMLVDPSVKAMIGTDWWARREVKAGKTPPPGWVEEKGQAVDEVTGKRIGWEPIALSPFAKFHAEALSRAVTYGDLRPGTYELVGPKINGNPSDLDGHELIVHGVDELPDFPRTYDVLREELRIRSAIDQMEGVVWWHPDGRRAKLKAKDFA